MIKIRLARGGQIHRAHYSIRVADAKNPRDGRFTEKVGYFNPHTNTVHVDIARAIYWLERGAQPTPRVRSLFSARGIMLAVYLLDGFNRGKVAKPVILKRLADWEKAISKRKEPKVNFVGDFSVRNLLEELPNSPKIKKKVVVKKAKKAKKVAAAAPTEENSNQNPAD